ncbi:MAG: GGDEF domain-containing protein [Patescibacteria group bacterium]
MFINKVRGLIDRFLVFVLRRRDPLTGLLDRSALKQINKKRFKNEEVSLVFLDLDNFKEVNDCLGHQLGDIFLKEFSNLLKREVRNRDLAIRWGGDEFIVCLFGASKKEAKGFLKRIRLKLRDIDITRRDDFLKLQQSIAKENFCDPKSLKEITREFNVSGGIAKVKESVFKAISIADQRMYRDKDRKGEKLPSKEVINPFSHKKERKKLKKLLARK